MKIVPLVLIVFVLAGCGGGGDKQTPPAKRSTPAATSTPAAAQGEDAVKAMFDDYRQSLVDRDWDKACSHLAPETTDKLKANIQQLGVTNPPSECAELMRTLYAAIDKDPAAKQAIDDIAKTAKVTGVKITGDDAALSWSAKVNGVDTPVTQSARIIDGEWKLIDVN